MRRCSSAILRYWPLVFSCIVMACGSTPRVFQSRFSQEYISSRDGQLRYKLPVGWLNATTDAPSPTTVIWLVRGDFAATLAVQEVAIDAATREEVNRGGLTRIAELMLALASGEGWVGVVKGPTLSALRGMTVCRYEYVSGHPADRVHVLLLDTGKRVYEVRALVTGTVPEETAGELLSLEEAFVENILW